MRWSSSVQLFVLPENLTLVSFVIEIVPHGTVNTYIFCTMPANCTCPDKVGIGFFCSRSIMRPLDHLIETFFEVPASWPG